MKKKFKIAIIGCGARSVPYAMALTASKEVELTACAEPNPANLRNMLSYTKVGEKSIRVYPDWRELLEKETELDGAVITTPNHLHRAPAEQLIGRDIPIALEKPITTTMRDTEAILLAEQAHKSRLLLGFVLRSTPFYLKVREILDSGRIGSVISIQADELVTPGISSVISRSPWRRAPRSWTRRLLPASISPICVI